MKLSRQLIYTMASWLILGMFLIFTQPDKLPVVFLIAPFLLIFAALYSLWVILRRFGMRYTRRERHRHLGVAVCTSVVLLLVLQSLGQLTLRDVMTVAAIVIIGYTYLGRIRLGLPQ